MHPMPTVSVLMSVYNGERYLAEAVESILNQSFTDFEFIIINDGSTDRTSEILCQYTDSRIRLVEQANMGLTRSLNKLLALTRGKYVARMDADDISLPERFAQQVAFLDSHPDTGVVGTAALVRDEIKGGEWIYPVATSDERIRRSLVKGNPLVHTSVMMHKSVIEKMGGYNESYTFAQDYELWTRLIKHTKMANLPDILVIHREHSGAISVSRRANWRFLWRSIWVRVGIHYKAFRAVDYPIYYIFYVLQPILFTLIEVLSDITTSLKKPERTTQ